ncbi:hypothetical protein [Rudaeicoccus suwonensis]|uniref:Uncharacterized protein n=1 Tax=Rudaeicoccus suwonensis TaxID=657409 RepID=A0A561DVB8_9MICO|nr:hypothetical protein [Rudaeicoccus suwonensis]TWE07308.1 hypothetical protein BKA23_3490 [Rudaeicoccus suwonensis]
MSEPSTAAPATRSAISLGAVSLVAGVVVAAALIVGAIAGHHVTAYVFAVAGLGLSWGWPVLIDAPRPAGSSIVLAIGTVGMTGVLLLSGHHDGMRALSAVLAVALVLAFLHELVRTDGRASLVLSIAGTCLGLAFLASGATYAAAAFHHHGSEAVAVTAGAACLGLLVHGTLGRTHAAEWSVPVSLALGAVLGLVVGLSSGTRWNILLLAGLIAAAVAAAVRRVVDADGTTTAATVAYGAAAILAPGICAYAAVWILAH